MWDGNRRASGLNKVCSTVEWMSKRYGRDDDTWFDLWHKLKASHASLYIYVCCMCYKPIQYNVWLKLSNSLGYFSLNFCRSPQHIVIRSIALVAIDTTILCRRLRDKDVENDPNIWNYQLRHIIHTHKIVCWLFVFSFFYFRSFCCRWHCVRLLHTYTRIYICEYVNNFAIKLSK